MVEEFTLNFFFEFKSRTTAPVTRLPFLIKDSTFALVTMTAPCLFAVRAIIIVWRASSTWASKYLTAPVIKSLRKLGAISATVF